MIFTIHFGGKISLFLVQHPYISMVYALPNTDMDPQNDGLEEAFPFQLWVFFYFWFNWAAVKEVKKCSHDVM